MKNFGFGLRPRPLEVVAVERRRDADQRRDARVFGADASARPTSRTTCPPPTAAPGYARAMKSSAARKSSCLAGPVVEAAGARAGAAEVEAQHRAADAAQRLGRLIHRPSCASCRRTADADARTRPRRACRRAAPASTRPVASTRRSLAGSSSSASRRPAGPGISRSIVRRRSVRVCCGNAPTAGARVVDELAGRSRRIARAW